MATKWAEYKRKQREKAKLSLGGEEPKAEATVPRIEAEVDESGVVLVQRRCNLCERTWGSTIPITCPYCHGKGIKIP